MISNLLFLFKTTKRNIEKKTQLLETINMIAPHTKSHNLAIPKLSELATVENQWWMRYPFVIGQAILENISWLTCLDCEQKVTKWSYLEAYSGNLWANSNKDTCFSKSDKKIKITTVKNTIVQSNTTTKKTSYFIIIEDQSPNILSILFLFSKYVVLSVVYVEQLPYGDNQMAYALLQSSRF